MNCKVTSNTPLCIFDKNVIELKDLLCICGGKLRPNIILFGEDLDKQIVMKTYTTINNNRYKFIIIIGTSLEFSYLRIFINKIKHFGSKVIHVNSEYINVKKNEIYFKDINELRNFLTK